MRMFLVLAALVTTSSVALSQPSSTYSRAFPPSQEALDRLNLKSDWTFYVPVSGQADGLAKIQILDEDQIAIQTKSGVLLLVDEGTGRQQWKFKYPGHFTSGYNVAVNAKYLFAVNVAKLYCFHRYTGLLEFEFDLPEAPSTGPLADQSQVYVALSGSKLMAFTLPPGLQISNDSAAKKATGAPPDNSKVRNPADVVADRYSTRTNVKSITDEDYDRVAVPKAYLETGSGASVTARSPSISTLASVVPPYTLHGLNKVESLSMLPSLRQPYRLNPDYLTYNQYSPSIAVIPASVARLLELTNLRPQVVKPEVAWSIGTSQKIDFDPILVQSKSQLTTPRVWITETGKNFVAVSQQTGARVVSGSFTAEPSGPLVGPFAYGKDSLLGFVTLTDGQLIGLDLAGGSSDIPKYEWKANVGGLLNHTPLVTKDAVYVSGDHAGVAKVDVASGDVTWRTESTADLVLAVNGEFVYVLNRRGELLVYAKDRIHDAVTKRAKPLTSLGVAGFNVPVQNPTTDRILLGADNGLIVCLRDASAKYAKPMRISPVEKLPPPAPKPEVKPAEPAPTPVEPKPADPKPVDPKAPKPVDPKAPKPADPKPPQPPKK